MTSLLNSSLPFDHSLLPEMERRLAAEVEKRRQKTIQSKRGGLIEFVRHFWDVLEPQTELIDGWPLEATCLHLEAVTFGDISRLLENVPPGFMKSLLANVFWPAWEWGPMNLPHLRYVGFSYAATLTLRDNGRFRDLVLSKKYQDLYGDRFTLTSVGVERIGNNKTGWKLASSVGGVGTGERGNRVILDDPHNVKEAESETVRSETVRWFQESMENRLNDLRKDAIIVIMQRVHESDVSGSIIEDGRYTHLCIPYEFEVGRDCETEIGWSDPRTEEGEPAWPERFPPEQLQTFKSRPYMWAGQYQQRPEPRGGGIFKRDWWRRWDDEACANHGVAAGTYPSFEYVLGILDTAYTEKEENDPCAMVALGIWHDLSGNPQVMLTTAWEGWLEFNPLVEKSAKTCRDFRIDRLLIEAKASGKSVAQELRRRYEHDGFVVEEVDPGKGDKVARAYAVTSVFEDGVIWAPGYSDGSYRAWADKVISQMASFPKAAHDDLTDTVTMGLKYLRERGLLVRRDEHARSVSERLLFQPKPRPLY